MPTDWFRPSRFVQHRISDPRVVQFWGKNHLVAKALKIYLPDSQADHDWMGKIPWGVGAIFPKDAKWDTAPHFMSGPVVRAAP